MAPGRQVLILVLMQVAVWETIGITPDKTAAKKALEYVERIRNSPCTGGTEEVLPVQFQHGPWNPLAEVALRMSNLLTKIVIRNSNYLSGVTDQFLFDLVRNNVDGESLIFGSAIAVEEYVYPRYRIFCPYAFKKDKVYAHDLSLNYNYRTPETEWYSVLKHSNWSDVYISENYVTYRYNATSHAPTTILTQPLAKLEYGHWTLPYYDCGGGDIWMVTYSAPIFGVIGPEVVFKGVGTIDIELTNIDINQCDLDTDDVTSTDGSSKSKLDVKSVDVFRGTHHCQETTKCVPVPGKGFVPGAYRCVCADGYYFPDTSLDPADQYFDGSVLERRNFNGSLDVAAAQSYRCKRCSEGCDVCVDDSPCLYSYNIAIRATLLTIAIVMVVLIVLVSITIGLYRNQRVIKSASPIFLHLVCVGAILMMLPVFVLFTEPSNMTCIISKWPRHVGFFLAYGALLLKTWRISAIFKVKSAKKLNLSDRVLAQRMLPILGVALAYLSAWSAVGGQASVWRRTGTSYLKFMDCSTDWWSYGAIIGEAAFLLWGAYLCFVVRKAPSVFNESKYITWTIYNNIILGSFIVVAREFIGLDQGPDVIYIFDFMYLQVSVTSLICLIFIPKLWVVFRKEDDAGCSETETVTGRQQKSFNPLAIISIDDTADKEVQVDMIQSLEQGPHRISPDTVISHTSRRNQVHPAT